GSTFNPKIGISWKPVRYATLRGSFGSSFKAPFLRSVYPGTTVTYSSIAAVPGAPDVNGDGETSVMYVGGGNRNLLPETGTSLSLGIGTSPARGLEIQATYFKLA